MRLLTPLLVPFLDNQPFKLEETNKVLKHIGETDDAFMLYL